MRAATVPTLLAVMVALVAPFLALPERASACSCSGKSAEELAADPTLTDIVQARVLAHRQSSADEEYVVTVSRRWRGAIDGQVTTHNWQGCGAELDLGREYVLSLGKGDEGQFLLSSCSIVVPVDGAWPAELEFLGEGTPVAPDNGDPQRLFTGSYEIGEGLQRDYLRLALVAAAAVAAAGVSIAVGRRT